jgi:hypothetical protein
MNPRIQDLVAAVEAAGANVRHLSDGRFSLVGFVPDEVLADIRANRDAFLAAWEEERRNRYLRCPPAHLRMRAKPPHWRKDVYRRVEAYAMRQTSEIARWVLLRGAEYHEAHTDWTERDGGAAALADLLHWQFADRHKEPTDVLTAFDEVLIA